MAHTIVRNLTNNIPLKLFSLLLGYTVWHIISAHQTITYSITIPVCFYNTSADCTINAPETVTLILKGKRSLLSEDYLKELALHIDATSLTKQKTILPITATQLFLPENVSLIHYVPSPLIIEKKIQQAIEHIEQPNKDITA